MILPILDPTVESPDKGSTRIKVKTFADGSQKFYAQYKQWFIWWTFQRTFYEDSYDIVYDTIEEAQKAIDKYLADKASTTITSTTFVKYP